MPGISDGKYIIDYLKEGCVEIGHEQTVLQASVESGIPIFHVCGGKAKCSTCRVLVLEGLEQLSPVNEKGRQLRNINPLPPNVRLACQTRVMGGGVKLQRIIRDETDIGLYVGEMDGNASKQIGEEVEVALLFMDIQNFTPFVESHLPFDVIHIIRKIFSVFQEIITSNNGVVIETAGDSIYAIFSEGHEMVEKCNSAVQSAFSMQDSLQVLNVSYFKKYFGEQISIGVGIHAGHVIKGAIHMGGQEHTIVMGYPVNLAARLQSATKTLNNSIVISKLVYDHMPIRQAGWKPAVIQVQGVTNPMNVFLLGLPYA